MAKSIKRSEAMARVKGSAGAERLRAALLQSAAQNARRPAAAGQGPDVQRALSGQAAKADRRGGAS